MKSLFQNKKFAFYFFLVTACFIENNSVAQCSWTVPPFVHNGIGVTKFVTGQAYYHATVASTGDPLPCVGLYTRPNTSDLLGLGMFPGQPVLTNTDFSYTVNFTQPVNDIELLIFAVDYETFVFSTNSSGTTLNFQNTCNFPTTVTTTSSGVKIVTEHDVDEDIRVRVHASTPYTTLNVSGPGHLVGGGNGSVIVFCPESVTSLQPPCSSYPISTITPNAPTTFCDGVGQVGLIGYISSAPLTYQWQKDGVNIPAPQGTSAVYTATQTGSYTVMTTNANGCSTLSAAVNVTANPKPTFTQGTVTNSTSCTGANGSIQFLGTDTGVIKWSGSSTGSTSTVTLPYTLTGIPAGAYNYQFTSNSGCLSDVITRAILGPTIPSATISASGATTLCSGNSVTLSTPFVSGTSYQWYSNGILIPGATGSSYAANTSGNYYLVVTNSSGCAAQSNAIPVTVYFIPSLSISSFTNSTSCSSANGSIQFSGGATGILSWTGTNAGNSGTVTLPYTLTGIAAGNYTYTFTTNGCPSTAVAQTIGGPASQSAVIIPGGSLSICSGGSVVLNANTGSGLTYQWMQNNVTISGATNSSYTATAAGTYTVVVTNSLGCAGTSGPVTVVLTAITAPSVASSGSLTFCSGGSVTLNISSATVPSDMFQWLLNGNPITGATAATYLATTSGAFTVRLTQASGCTATSNAVNVNTNPNPTITAGAIANSTSCIVPNGSVQFLGVGTGVIKWTGTSSGTSTSITLPSTLTSVNAGTYNYVFVNASGCSSNTLPLTIGGPIPPAVSITATGSLNICAGGSVMLNGNAGSGLSYQWKLNGSNIPNAIGDAYTALNAGSYSLMVMDNNSGCSATAGPSVVTVNTLPTPTITANGPLSFCPGGTVTLTANPNSGYTYQWQLNGAIISGATNATYSTSNAGQYAVVIGSAGCNSPSSPVTVQVNPLPTVTITATGTTTICTGNTVVLTASGGTTYQWKLNGNTISGATSNSYNASAAGTYTVDAMNANGCSNTSAATTVTISAPPTITTQNTSSQTTCLNGSLNPLSLVVAGTGNTYQWYSSPVASTNGGTLIAGATASSYQPTSASLGNTYYYCIITNPCGMSITSPMSGVIIVQLSASITGQSMATQTVCEGSALIPLSVTTTGSSVTYQWYSNTTASTTGGTAIPGATSNTFTPPTNLPGTIYYYCKVTDACGTQLFSAVSEPIHIQAQATVTFNANQQICKGQNLDIALAGTPNSTLNYSVDGNAGQVICDALGAGKITLNAVNESKTVLLNTITTSGSPMCSKSLNQTIQITVNDYPAKALVEGKTNYCIGETMQKLAVINGQGGEIKWYSDIDLTKVIATSPSFLPEPTSAVYYATIKNASGCETKPTFEQISISDCEFPIYSAFTPDGDHVNDTWTLNSIDAYYPKNVVRIYNRWGNLLFESEPGKYENKPWDAKYGGQELPIGSYYYVIMYNDEFDKHKHGTITVIRKEK